MPNVQEKPRKVEPRLPSPALPDANWADCYQLRVNDSSLTAMEAARQAIGHFPPWVEALMAIRNILVAPFGLKSPARDLADVTQMIGIFPIVSSSENQVVLGFDDRHLDFRIVVDVADDAAGKSVSMTTLVRRKILFGKIYIAAITPFHNLIVQSTLASLGKRGTTVNPRP